MGTPKLLNCFAKSAGPSDIHGKYFLELDRLDPFKSLCEDTTTVTQEPEVYNPNQVESSHCKSEAHSNPQLCTEVNWPTISPFREGQD